VIFSLGMYLVVYGLRNAGLTDYLAGLLEQPPAAACGALRWGQG
jgi:arsenical pump membrane protein